MVSILITKDSIIVLFTIFSDKFVGVKEFEYLYLELSKIK